MTKNSSEHNSLYRKYRPSLWDEVFGQDKVVQVLKNSIRRKKISHAYLFCGPRGTGKTSSARIFSCALNCENPKDANPCLECSPCQAFLSGNYPDLHELDAASNRKIDDFREIRDQVKYPPLEGKDKFKIFIIDEAHMLTKEAANAFLKTLEEPPSYIVFILATTEPQKLLPTIVSRCIRLDFELLSMKASRERLELVMEAESITADQGVVEQIITRGGGGMRDTLTLLEQAVQFCGHKLETDEYLNMMGLASLNDVDQILEFYMRSSQGELVRIFKDCIRSGKNPNELIFQVVQRIQEYIYFLLQIPGPYSNIPVFCKERSVDYWNRVYGHFLNTMDLMRQGLFPEYYGEFGLLTSIEEGSQASPGEVKSDPGLERRISDLEKKLESGFVQSKATASDSSDSLKNTKTIAFRDESLNSYPEAKRNWLLIKKDLKKVDPMLHALLKDAVATSEEGKFCLYFKPVLEFHYNKIQNEKQLATMSEVIAKRYGPDTKLELILGDPPQKEGESSNPIKKSSVSSENIGSSKEEYVSDELREKLLTDPGLKQIVDELGAEIKNVD